MNCITTITGPSGVGKSTLATYLCKHHAFQELTSTTSRAMRPGEINGEHYHFVTEAEFESMIDRGQLTQYVNFLGNYYGSTRREVESAIEQGKNPLIVVEPTGVPQIAEFAQRNGFCHRAVFVNNPTELLISRMLARLLSEDKKDIKTYTNRLMSITGPEQHWGELFDFDSRYARLDEATIESIAIEIANDHEASSLAEARQSRRQLAV